MVKQFITPLLRGVIFSERVTVGPRLIFPGGPIILGICLIFPWGWGRGGSTYTAKKNLRLSRDQEKQLQHSNPNLLF